MLAKIFGSNARVKILKHFLLNPDKNSYIRQLSRDLDLQLNSVRRELENLEKFGLLLSGNGKPELAAEGDTAAQKAEKAAQKQDIPQRFEKKYFRVNRDFVLYEEIKSLFIKSKVLYEQDFVEKIKKTGKIRLFVLTGFFANNPGSPVDILIVGHLNRDKFVGLINDLEKDLHREVNFTIMEPKEFRYRLDMTDKFLINIIEGKKIIVVNEILQ